MTHPTDREGCDYKQLDTMEFDSFISSNELLDVPIVNSRFTWYGPANKKSHLNRDLLSEGWFNRADWSFRALMRKNSDHKPLVLQCRRLNWGPKPFKFFNCWLEDSVFIKHLGHVWLKLASGNIQYKLKHLKRYVKEWTKSNSGNLEG